MISKFAFVDNKCWLSALIFGNQIIIGFAILQIGFVFYFHPSFNGSLLVSIFNTTNALFRFKAPLHIVMHKHEFMEHHTLKLNMSMYGAYHSLDGLLGIYAYITHLSTYKHGMMDGHTLSFNLWM